MKNYKGGADRSHNGSLIVAEYVRYRPLTKRQYLRDVELKGSRRKRITLPMIGSFEEVEKRLNKAEAERFIKWRKTKH